MMIKTLAVALACLLSAAVFAAAEPQGPQHAAHSNAGALRAALSAPAHRGLSHPPMARQGVVGVAQPASDSHALNSAVARQVGAGGPGAIAASRRAMGAQAIGAHAMGAGTVASNATPGNHRSPTGLVSLGGAVTNRNTARAVLDGNAVHHRF